MTVPEQPDGIEDTSYDLPTLENAARRAGEFLSQWGDGLIEIAFGGLPPLYSRDLQVLINQVLTPPRT